MTAQLLLAVEPAEFIRTKIGQASFTSVHLLEMVNYLSYDCWLLCRAFLFPDVSTIHSLIAAYLATHRFT